MCRLFYGVNWNLIDTRSRSPGHRVPWWVLIWIKRSPLVFLVLSVACFSVGFVLFAYSSQQACVLFSLPSSSTYLTLESCGNYSHHRLHSVQFLRVNCGVHMVRI